MLEILQTIVTFAVILVLVVFGLPLGAMFAWSLLMIVAAGVLAAVVGLVCLLTPQR